MVKLSATTASSSVATSHNFKRSTWKYLQSTRQWRNEYGWKHPPTWSVTSERFKSAQKTVKHAQKNKMSKLLSILEVWSRLSYCTSSVALAECLPSDWEVRSSNPGCVKWDPDPSLVQVPDRSCLELTPQGIGQMWRTQLDAWELMGPFRNRSRGHQLRLKLRGHHDRTAAQWHN